MRILRLDSASVGNAHPLEFQDMRIQLARLVEESTNITAAFWQKLPDLVDRLCELGASQDLYGMVVGNRLEIYASGQLSLLVRVDWFDYGPLLNGIPTFHYRIEVRHGARIVRETRRETTDAMVMLILGELGDPGE